MNISGITSIISYSSFPGLGGETFFDTRTMAITTLAVIGIGLAIGSSTRCYRAYSRAQAAAYDLANTRARVAAQTFFGFSVNRKARIEYLKALLGAQNHAKVISLVENVETEQLSDRDFAIENMKSLETLRSVPLFLARFVLWKAGVDVNAPGIGATWRRKLVHEAIVLNKCEELKLLKALGADFKACYSGMGETPFYIAVQEWKNINKNLELLRLLQNFGADVDGVTPDTLKMEPALHKAVRDGDAELAKLLIDEFKANPNVLDEYGRTPIFTAVDEENTDLIQALHDRGANMNAQVYGATAFDKAKSTKTRDKLIELGAKTRRQLEGQEDPPPRWVSQEGWVSQEDSGSASG